MNESRSKRDRKRKKWQRTGFDRLLYICLNNFFRLLWKIYLGLRINGADRYPPEGPGLVCANHQSHLDPILVGNGCRRYISFVARESLFRVPLFGWLIRRLGAFPINRQAGISGIKNTLQRLKSGELVLIFPEGTRTPDGSIQEFKPGFCTIARRAKVPIIPVAIAGAYEAWPKTGWFPRPKRVAVKVGQPIGIEQIDQLSDDELTSLVHQQVIALQNELLQNELMRKQS